MNVALIIGRKDSEGFPKKNLLNVLGRPLASYAMIAAKESKYIDRAFISTDCEELRELGNSFGIEYIERPACLASKEALGEDAYKHGYDYIKNNLNQTGDKIETLSLLMCNAATITANLLDKGIEKLRNNLNADSAVTVSIYNMWSPVRARKLNDDGYLNPFVPFENYDINPENLTCDRDSQGDVYYADMGVSVIRPRCMENIDGGLLPQKWMGKNILPIENWGGLDLDYPWQVGMVEFWLREHGFKYYGMNGR